MRTNTKRYFFIIIFLVLISQILNAQTETNYQKALSFFEQSKFKEADFYFRKALREKDKQPVEIKYFYGATLYNLDKTELSEKFLSDYVESNDSKPELIKKAKSMLLNINPKNCQKCYGKFHILKDSTCFRCEGSGKVESKCLYCNGSKKIPCYVCKGAGMIHNTGKFENKTFARCEHCKGSGIDTCVKCMIEELKTKDCERCKGSGKVKEKVFCNHEF
ncbi:MAG: hypothetical protein SNJ77_04565 [Cytophagales bacterium]